MKYSLIDKSNGYGLLSIILHWISVFLIFTLWFIGNSIKSDNGNDSLYDLMQLHVSIAVFGFFFIFIRVLWRIIQGHPRIDGQKNSAHYFAKITHYTILFLMIFMLSSGVLMVLSSGLEYSIFGFFNFSSQFVNYNIFSLSKTTHFFSATSLIVLSVLHILAAFKHMMFNNDDLLIRIVLPIKND